MKLFRPAWDSKNEKRAVRAISKMKDEIKLGRAAREAWCLKARLAAVEKLTDQGILADIVEKGSPWIVFMAVTDKLTDPILAQRMYAHAATNATNVENYGYALSAISKLTDQEWLCYVAKNSKSHSIQHSAIEKLTSQDLLADVVLNGKDTNRNYNPFTFAVSKLTDQEWLTKIAKNGQNQLSQFDHNAQIRVSAADQLINRDFAQEVYAEIASDFRSGQYAKQKAIRHMTDIVLLTEYSNFKPESGSYKSSCEAEEIRQTALYRIEELKKEKL